MHASPCKRTKQHKRNDGRSNDYPSIPRTPNTPLHARNACSQGTRPLPLLARARTLRQVDVSILCKAKVPPLDESNSGRLTNAHRRIHREADRKTQPSDSILALQTRHTQGNQTPQERTTRTPIPLHSRTTQERRTSRSLPIQGTGHPTRTPTRGGHHRKTRTDNMDSENRDNRKGNPLRCKAPHQGPTIGTTRARLTKKNPQVEEVSRPTRTRIQAGILRGIQVS